MTKAKSETSATDEEVIPRAKIQGADLGGLVDADSTKCFIQDARGKAMIGSDGKSWFIELAGPSHKKTVEARNRAIRKVLKQRRKSQKTLDDVTDTEIEEVALNQIEPLLLRTLGWGPIELNGEDFKFNNDNSKALYNTSSIIRTQVEAFLQEESSFLPGSKPPS